MDNLTSSQVTSDDVRCPLANIVAVLPVTVLKIETAGNRSQI